MNRSVIDQLYLLSIPEVQDIFLQVMQNVVDRAMLDEMVIAIENGDVDTLFRVSGFTPAVLAPLLDRIEQVYKDTANAEVAGWPKRIITPVGIVQPMFDMRNSVVEKELKDFSSKFITNITEETRENVRIILQDGAARGDNPRKTALNIVGRVNPVTRKREGGVIGLSTRQTRTVVNVKGYLENLDKDYFKLRLRDKRFDKTVLAAIESGKPLNTETIDKLTTVYKSKALKYRAEMISRTETIQAINRGNRAPIVQAISEGLIKTGAITKWWDDAGDGRVRTSHNVLGNKYNSSKAIGFDEPFVSPFGSRMMQPGDDSLGANANEIVHCRCLARYEIDWFYDLKDKR